MPKTTEIAASLEALATSINGAWSDDRPLSQVVGGWNMPTVRKADLVRRAKAIAKRINALKSGELSSDLSDLLGSVPQQVAWMQSNALPQLAGGNGQIVVANLEVFFSSIEQALPAENNLNWEDIEDAALIPKKLARRIRSLEASLERLAPRMDGLDGKITLIEEAHSAAENLPTEMVTLEETTKDIKKLATDASSANTKVGEAKKEADTLIEDIRKHEVEAKKLVENCEGAYSAATALGLAASFSERARKLGWSMIAWVVLLVGALGVAGGLGFYRLQALQDLLKGENSDPAKLWLNFAMSVFTVGAPIWLAWVSTRQISQRFRLAEDYAFKASVARAYEGYRREAARLDPDLEARLFASALDRLEEAPLRFIATEEHSTPYQELLASSGFQKSLERFPDFRASLRDMLGKFNKADREVIQEAAE